MFHVLDPAGEEDSSPMAICFRLRNIGPSLTWCLVFIVGSKLSILHGKHPSEWEEVIFMWKFCSERHEIESQKVFAGKNVNSWVVIDFLKKMHLDEDVRRSIDRSVQYTSQSPLSLLSCTRHPSCSATSLTTGYWVTQLTHSYLTHL